MIKQLVEKIAIGSFSKRKLEVEDSYLPVIRDLLPKIQQRNAEEYLLKEFIKTSFIRFFVINSDYEILFSNNPDENIDYHNKKCYEYLCGDDVVDPNCPLKKSLGSNNIEFIVKKYKNGETVLVACYPLRNNGDKFVMEFAIDVSNSNKRNEIIDALEQCVIELKKGNI